MLGMIDWGIGGISIFKLIKERLGDIPVVYLSDTGATPYGMMERRAVAARLDRVVEFLKTRGMTHLVIGCNAASTAIPDLADHGIPIQGVIVPAVEAAVKLRPTRLGLIGGRRTVLSGIYRRAFADRGIALEQRIAQPLSGMIERGDISSASLRSEARRILSPLRNCSHILLACTHYPAIEGLLSEFVSPGTRFIDPAEAAIAKVRRWKLPTAGNDEFLTTGDPKQMKMSASLAFQVTLQGVKKVAI